MFKLESEMKEPVQRWLLAQGLQTKSEFQNPWGICDLVGCAFDEDRTRHRLAQKQGKPVGPPFRVQLLLRIPDQDTGRSVSVKRIHQGYSELFDYNEVCGEIDELVARRFVVRTKRGNLQKVNGWMPLQTDLVAVELKMGRINEVISQARNNRQLTPNSYMALPLGKALNVASTKREVVTEAGVGLLAVTKANCEVLISPSKSRKQVNQVAECHCVERFWQSYLKTA